MALLLVGGLISAGYLAMAAYHMHVVDIEIDRVQQLVMLEQANNIQDVMNETSGNLSHRKVPEHKMTRKSLHGRREEVIGFIGMTPTYENGMPSFSSYAVLADDRGRKLPDNTSRTAIANYLQETLAQYFYFTDSEREPDNFDLVTFRYGDDITGKVYTNDQLALATRSSPQPRTPIFRDFVQSASEDITWTHPLGGGPEDPEEVFLGGYELGVPPIVYPHNAENVRNNAIRRFSTHWWNPETQEEEEVAVRIEFKRSGRAKVTRHRFRQPGNPLSYHVDWAGQPGGPHADRIVDTLFTGVSIPQWPEGGSWFIDGVVELKGVFKGNLSVGASGNIYISDHLYYADSDTLNFIRGMLGKPPENSKNYLGIISEKRVIIANSAANRQFRFRGQEWGLVLNAAIAALGDGVYPEDRGAFTVQHMCGLETDAARLSSNEPWMHELPHEGTVLTFWGAIAQRYRGYVHRTYSDAGCNNFGNHGGFHDKDYHYDERFYTQSPPDYIEVEYANGGKSYVRYNWREMTGVND